MLQILSHGTFLLLISFLKNGPRTKLKSNPENDVGLLTMSDNYLVSTLTADQQKFQSVMAKVQPEGEVKLSAAVRVAQLSLKHRMVK